MERQTVESNQRLTIKDMGFVDYFSTLEAEAAFRGKRPYMTDLEITSKCAGGCIFCYAGSTVTNEELLPKEKAFHVIDDSKAMGIKTVQLMGGDPFLHPDWPEIVSYAKEREMDVSIIPTFVSKRQARLLYNLVPDQVCIHIDTIDPETFNKVNLYPHTLQKRIESLHNLLDAGFAPKSIVNIITMTRPVIERIEEIIDWTMDAMGLNGCFILAYRSGTRPPLVKDSKALEPGKSDIRRAFEYLARKTNHDKFLRFGCTTHPKVFCLTRLTVLPDGGVTNCYWLSHLAIGNIHQRGLREIVEGHWEELIQKKLAVKGYCAEECPNREVCFGCRASALHYTGDLQASDPKCWWNPANPEYSYLH